MDEITTPRPDRSATGTLAPLRRFTVDEYLKMTESGILTGDDAVELIHGQIVEMRPENSPHRVCVAKINQTLARQLADATYFVQTQSTPRSTIGMLPSRTWPSSAERPTT